MTQEEQWFILDLENYCNHLFYVEPLIFSGIILWKLHPRFIFYQLEKFGLVGEFTTSGELKVTKKSVRN